MIFPLFLWENRVFKLNLRVLILVRVTCLVSSLFEIIGLETKSVLLCAFYLILQSDEISDFY